MCTSTCTECRRTPTALDTIINIIIIIIIIIIGGEHSLSLCTPNILTFVVIGEFWCTLAHPLSGDGRFIKKGTFSHLLHGLTCVVLFVEPIIPGIVLHCLGGSNKEMESQQSLVLGLINYCDSSMYIHNPMEITVHQYGNLNMQFHLKLAQLTVASHVVNYFCGVCNLDRSI